MSWYKIGTISATNGSKIITGTGTQFINPLNGVSAGRMLLLPAAGTVQIYEIESVQSDTQLTLVSAFIGTTGTGKAYAIPTSPAVSIEQFAHEFASMLAYYQQQLSGWQQILTGTGNVTLTTPDGQTVAVRSQQAWDAALDGKANSSDVFLLKGALGTNDLNNVIGTDYQGIWWQNATANATAARNYPVVSAGNLLVLYNSVSNYGITQVYITHASKRIFIRSKPTSTDAWMAWGEFWTSDNLVKQTSQDDTTAGSVVLNGGHGLGANARPRAAGATGGAAGCGFFSYTANHADNPFGGTGGSGLHVQESGAYGWDLLGRDGGGIDFRLRQVSAGVASPWSTLWTSANLIKQTGVNDTTHGSILINGAHGLGRSQASGVAMPSIADGNNAATSGFAEAGSSTNWYYAFSPAVVAFRAGGADGTGQVMQIQVGPGGELAARYRAGNAWTDWAPHATLNTTQTVTGQKTFTTSPIITASNSNAILDDSNVATGTVGRTFRITNNGGVLRIFRDPSLSSTTGRTYISFPTAATGTALVSGNNAVADSNGFWKTASPVVKLFSNGTSELTSEAEGITTERLSEGVYRISGCLGLNADRAWGGDEGGIDVPMCRNKLPRLWVDYGGDEASEQINPDGSIIIRTYHRPHPDAPAFARNEIEGYANGDPIDIPRDTFISVRVQMPERDEDKPKVMHSNVYCNTVARAKRKSRAARR